MLCLFIVPRLSFADDAAGSAGPLPNGFREAASDRAVAIKELCEATAATGRFTGAVLVARDGRVVYQGAFGLANREWDIPNTVDTRFRLASVSKQFCSMLVMQLVQEGRIELQDPITKHLPYYRKDTGEKITVHHLLSHQSGLKDFTSSPNYRGTTARLSFGKDEFIKLHCSSDLAHEPGTIYSYCNAGYIILGRIIEQITGKSFETNLKERVFGPLEMASSGYDHNRTLIMKRASGYTYGPFGVENADYLEMDSSPGASGALYSTVGDMFRWDRALKTDALLNQEYRDLMFTPNRDVPEVKAAGGRPHSVYGYGWQIFTRTHPVTKRRTRVINHGGAISGFRAMENRLVDDDAFVIVLCNLGDRNGESEVWNTVTRLSAELIHVVTDQPYRMPGKPRLTQDQRLYAMVKKDGVDAAIEWFRSNGRQAAWGGTLFPLAEQLIQEGEVDKAIRLMETDVAMTPGKPWMLRKTVQACLENGLPEKALSLVDEGLELRPGDERFLLQKAQAEKLIPESSVVPERD